MDVRKKIEKIYKDYEDRNLPGVLSAIPDDFCFEWPFDPETARYSGTCRCKNDFLIQLEDLAKNFEFKKYSASNIIVEGDRVAAQISLSLTSRKTGDTFDTTIAHFWTFNNGRPVKLVEYMDTALMAHQCM